MTALLKFGSKVLFGETEIRAPEPEERTVKARDSNPHLIFKPSETVKRVRIKFENIRYNQWARGPQVKND